MQRKVVDVLTPRLPDLVNITRALANEGVTLKVLALGIDTSTSRQAYEEPVGLNCEFERDIVSERSGRA